MTKADIVEILSLEFDKLGLKKADFNRITEKIFNVIKDEALKNVKVSIANFGSFEKKVRKAKPEKTIYSKLQKNGKDLGKVLVKAKPEMTVLTFKSKEIK